MKKERLDIKPTQPSNAKRKSEFVERGFLSFQKYYSTMDSMGFTQFTSQIYEHNAILHLIYERTPSR